MCGKPGTSSLFFQHQRLAAAEMLMAVLIAGGQGLKHLFYYVSLQSPEPVDFKLWGTIAASAKSTFTQTPLLFSKCWVIRISSSWLHFVGLRAPDLCFVAILLQNTWGVLDLACLVLPSLINACCMCVCSRLKMENMLCVWSQAASGQPSTC